MNAKFTDIHGAADFIEAHRAATLAQQLDHQDRPFVTDTGERLAQQAAFSRVACLDRGTGSLIRIGRFQGGAFRGGDAGRQHCNLVTKRNQATEQNRPMLSRRTDGAR